MSAEPKNIEISAEQAKAAALQIFDQVAEQAFFDRMAAHGCPAKTAEEACDMLSRAVALQQLNNLPAVKAANAERQRAADPYAAADAYLTKMASEAGFIQPQAEDYRKIAASILEQYPSVYAAAVTLNHGG